MTGLISPDIEDEVLHRPFAFRHIPVRDSNVRDLEVFVCPLWHETSVHFFLVMSACCGFASQIMGKSFVTGARTFATGLR